MRVKTDRITHVTAWYFAGRQEPAVLLDYGKDLTKPFGGGQKQLLRQDGWRLSDGAEMAFARNADGKGYVQELKLPWKLVNVGQAVQGRGEVQLRVRVALGRGRLAGSPVR